MKKYYEILEVNPKASIEVIEKAYKVLVKKYHPDAYEGEGKIYAEQRLRDINEAYKILSDEFLREQYDAELQKETTFNYIYKDDNKTKQNRKIRRSDKYAEEEKEIKIKRYKRIKKRRLYCYGINRCNCNNSGSYTLVYTCY